MKYHFTGNITIEGVIEADNEKDAERRSQALSEVVISKGFNVDKATTQVYRDIKPEEIHDMTVRMNIGKIKRIYEKQYLLHRLEIEKSE
ncbi:MAG: hypothetical protein JSV50_04350 [Desulfobacteraceae bacterium]|nr:MAG: hypothetical protein JSV50_04350 [Desulfobacteraceae bacterium]